MDATPTDHATVFRTREQRECRESHLVLDAAGIPAETVFRDGWWWLIVNRGDVAIATAELEAYRRENPKRSECRGPAVPLYRGAVLAVLVYAGVLILIAIQTAQGAYGLEWLSAGRMQAGRVVAGEWWRVVTALTLHLDAGHLLANLTFGVAFGFLAGRVLGGGVAWFAIVIAGAFGNLLNALAQPATHSSIGASTAVFATLGVIVSHALRPRASFPERPLKRWSPLIGGVLLFAFTGLGDERTDVVAHVTGFLAGLLVGRVGRRLPHRWLASRDVQQWAGFATIAMVATAWVVGLAVAG